MIDKSSKNKSFKNKYNKYKNKGFTRHTPLSTEELKLLKDKNKKIIEKVKEWQEFKFIKHLTCGKEDCGTKLVPREVNNKVILQCPKCNEIQAYIPKVVLKTKFSFPEALLKLKSLYSNFFE